MNRRICIFTAHYFPYLGGVESYTYNLSKALKALGDDVIIVTSNDMNLKVYEKMDDIPVYRMPCFNLMGGRIPISKINQEFIKIEKKISKEHFDLVIINTRFYPHTVYGAWFARRHNIRCIILDHGTSHVKVGNHAADIAFAAMEHGLTFIEKRLCKEFFGVSKACCRWLGHFRIKPKGVLYNAVDIKKIESAIQNPVCSFKDKLCLSDDTLIITFTGRLLKEKGILNLTEAVNQLPAELNACLLIAGDGDEMDNVKKQSGIRVKVLGRLSFEEVAALLRETDIFCLPTEYPEGFPTSVLEAAAAGCYVITTDKGGSKELIRDKSYGRILTEATPKKICDAIVEAALNENLRKNASVKAEERVRQMFTWEHTAKQVHALAENNVGDRT